jgi:hypothetical protein
MDGKIEMAEQLIDKLINRIKEDNLFFLLKKSLTLWILIGFFISLFFHGIDSIYLSYILTFSQYIYIILIITTNIKSTLISKNINTIKHLFLVFFSFIIFSNNKIILTDYILDILLVLFIILFLYLLFWFIHFKMLHKLFSIKLYFISSILEFILILSILILGINYSLTIKFLIIGMFDIIYGITVLTSILHLNKRFNMLLIQKK